MMESPHRRFNLLTREWVLVSPHRAKRPWLGQVEKTPAGALSGYDPACYLCPGNERAGGVRNPSYTGTFAFDNDFSALLPDLPSKAHTDESPLLRSEPERGLCRVICFSPRHDLTLPELDLPAIEAVLAAWAEQSADLGARDFIRSVQVFENKGAIMGYSNPHPHSQANMHRDGEKTFHRAKQGIIPGDRPVSLHLLLSQFQLVSRYECRKIRTMYCQHRSICDQHQ
jgi:UDPglucose--hexose-1-phosphate uridylyltransferase